MMDFWPDKRFFKLFPGYTNTVRKQNQFTQEVPQRGSFGKIMLFHWSAFTSFSETDLKNLGRSMAD